MTDTTRFRDPAPSTPGRESRRPGAGAGLALGLAAGLVCGLSLAAAPPPTEHKGLSVESLGVAGEETLEATLGLDGRKLQLRAITIEPGGQIARHDHATRPGLVKVLSGEWVEGRPSGETIYGPDSGGLVEDEATVHWFFNRGDEPATAVVCDIVPAG